MHVLPEIQMFRHGMSPFRIGTFSRAYKSALNLSLKEDLGKVELPPKRAAYISVRDL